MPEMNYNPLLGRIKEMGLTQKECAKRLGISEGQLSRKLSGEFVFRQDEINGLCDILEIDARDIGRFFFPPKVEKHQRIGRPPQKSRPKSVERRKET